MKQEQKHDAMAADLQVAIGLVWGHLSVCQFEQAYQLAQGCLSRWPQDARLALMAAYAGIEIGKPLDQRMQAALSQGDCEDFAELVLRRAHQDTHQACGTGGADHE